LVSPRSAFIPGIIKQVKGGDWDILEGLSPFEETRNSTQENLGVENGSDPELVDPFDENTSPKKTKGRSRI